MRHSHPSSVLRMNPFIPKSSRIAAWTLAITLVLISASTATPYPQLHEHSATNFSPQSNAGYSSAPQQHGSMRLRQNNNPPNSRVKYNGSGAMLGGLIGGGLATTLGGILGDEFTLVIGSLGGMLGGAVGSGLDSTGNGLAILGAAVGGSIGAGLGVRLKEHLFQDSENSKYSYKGLLDSASNTISKPLETATKVVGGVTAPLQSVASPVIDVIKKPVENVTGTINTGLDAIKKPTEGVTGAFNPIKNMFGKKRALDGIPNPVSAVTDLAAAPVGMAGSVVAGSVFKAMSKPLLAGVMSGLFGAIGGGTGALIGSWGFHVMQNIIV